MQGSDAGRAAQVGKIAINIRVIYDVTHLIVNHLLMAIIAFEEAEELDHVGVLWDAMRGQLCAVDAFRARHRTYTALPDCGAREGLRTSESNWSPVPSKQRTSVLGAAGWYGGMISLSPVSLDDECTLDGVMGRGCEGADVSLEERAVLL